MPINIEKMQKDPEFQALPQDRREALLKRAMQENAAKQAAETATQGTAFEGQAISAEPGMAEKIARLGTRLAIPTAGSMLANYGGALIPGVRDVPPPIREAAGSVVGTGINMALGLQEPSLKDLAMAAAVPGASRIGGRVAANVLPGARAARAIDIADEARQIPSILERKITKDPEQLFQSARQMNPQIRIAQSGNLAAEVVKREGEASTVRGLKFPRVQAMAQDLVDLSKQQPATTTTTLQPSSVLDHFGNPLMVPHTTTTPGKTGTVALADLDTVRQRIGALIGSTENVAERGELKRLYAGIMQDMENAAAQGVPGAEHLMEGITQQRRAFAAQDLEELITANISKPRPVDGLQTVDTGKLLKTLQEPQGRKYELLNSFLDKSPAERAEIESLLHDMNRRNVRLMPPAGSMFGSGPYLARASGAMAAAKMLGMDPTTAAGVTTAGSYIISRALMTHPGREMLRQMMADSSTINTTQIALQLLGHGALSLGESQREVSTQPSTGGPQSYVTPQRGVPAQLSPGGTR